MDTFVEQIVRKPSSKNEKALKLTIAILTAVISAVAVMFLLFIGLIFTFLAVYTAYMLISSFDCEYEYIVTNGELDVDKIIAKRKRRRLLSIKASDFTGYGLLKDAPTADGETTTVMASGLSDGDAADYFADFNHKTLGKARLVFSPEERVVQAIKPYVPRAIRYNAG